MYILVGLGNPGEEYSNTRHNTGRMFMELIAGDLPASGSGLKIFSPDSFMNVTGKSVAKIIKTKKAAEKLIVVYDDVDLPLGAVKISYNRGSGGHKGLESIIKSLKTREFIRIRFGVTPTTPGGKLKKPKTEADKNKFILGEFKKLEMEKLKKVFKRAKEAVETIIEKGYVRAMTEFN